MKKIYVLPGLYKKGISTTQIVNTLEYFHSIGTKNMAYLLLGLPLVRNRNIANLLTLKVKYDSLIKEYRASFFRLSDKIEIYKNHEKYRIKIGNQYSIGDLFDNDNLPHIKTAYTKFISWNADDNRWKNRTEILDKYIAMNSLFGLNYNSLIYKTTLKTY